MCATGIILKTGFCVVPTYNAAYLAASHWFATLMAEPDKKGSA
jgi:hypothetical protein